MFETIDLRIDPRGVATLLLNRAEKHNSMNAQMIAELTEVAAQIAADDAIRVVVLTGAGASFCAGGDLGWMKEQVAANAEERAAEARKLAMMLNALDTLPKPLIGRIQGQAFGGGIGMMSVCDVAIGVEGAKFGLTETRLGLIPATISPYVIGRMGPARARRVMMSARLFGSDEAERLGLLARVVDADKLDAAIEAEVKPYLSAAPGAVARTKQLIREQGGAVSQDQIEASIAALVETWEGAEAGEGIAAFFDKRKANWVR
ncbi:MAG: crotonase/enoyl-CoA hydratase family protein [Rhodobacteraceae bacterium]|nr:crotonase/enoyl-CoA hydratase family protein [Paracoccaceae bacterium]